MGLIITLHMFQMLGSGPAEFAEGYGFQPDPTLRKSLVVCLNQFSLPSLSLSLSLSFLKCGRVGYFEVQGSRSVRGKTKHAGRRRNSFIWDHGRAKRTESALRDAPSRFEAVRSQLPSSTGFVLRFPLFFSLSSYLNVNVICI